MSTRRQPGPLLVQRNIDPLDIGPAADDELRATIVLAGAGISKAPPTCGPLGAEMVTSVFHGLMSAPSLTLPRGCKRWLAGRIGSLRLELFLQLLAKEIPRRTLVGIYQHLANREPNLNHFGLTALGLPIVTTNQDLLLEEAARRLGIVASITHLHGSIDRPDSIVTVLDQYLRGLAAAQRDKLSLVNNQHLVVMGYSGQDRDVMAVLGRLDPRSVTWLVHPQADGSVYVPPPEVRECRSRLGDRIRFFEVEADRWLDARQPARWRQRLQREAPGAGSSPTRPPPRRLETFSSVPLIRRFLSVAWVVAHFVGGTQRAADCFKRIDDHLGPCPRAKLGLAIALNRLGRTDHALELLARVSAPTAEPRTRVSALLWRIQIYREHSQYQLALDTVQELSLLIDPTMAPRLRKHGEAWSAAHTAGIARIEGRPKESLDGYRRSYALFRSREMDGLIDSLTWQAEVLCFLGEFKRGRNIAARAAALSKDFFPQSNAAWPTWVGAVVASAAGVDDAFGKAQVALADFKAAGNLEGQSWSLFLLVNIRRHSRREAEADGALAKAELAEAFDLAHSGERVNLPLTGRLHLISADIDRMAGNDVGMRCHLAEAHRVANSACFTQRLDYLELYGRLVECECLRALDAARGEAEEGVLATRFTQLGLYAYGARCRATSLARHGGVGTATWRNWRRRGWVGVMIPEALHVQYPLYFI